MSGSLGNPHAGFQPLRWARLLAGLALDVLYSFAIVLLAGGGLVVLAVVR